AGTYEVYAVDNNGCSGQTVGLSITQPAPIALTVDSLSCNSNLLTIGINAAGGTSPYNYLWSPGGQTQQLLTGLAPGFYTITVTDANGCSIVSTQNYNCPPSELHRKDDKPDLSEATVSTIDLYPNPNSGTFTLSGLEEGQTIEMYDYTGRMISSQLVNDNIQTTMNIAGQPAGIYLVRILDKNGNLVMLKKMIKTN
ncbi:MAG TPA: T9SS type A sorting domain-containing protein, partial [Bacteroidia bacterium]|nr:T9SS type A sorting domain-containing protein [Bacteroidia bacterium]